MIKHDRMVLVAKECFSSFVDMIIDNYIKYGEDKSVVILKHFMEDYNIATVKGENGATAIQDLTLGEFFACNYQVEKDKIETFEELFFKYFASAIAYDITKMMQQLLISIFGTDIEFKAVDKIIAEIDVNYFSHQYQNKCSEIVSIINDHGLIDRKVHDFLPVEKNDDK